MQAFYLFAGKIVCEDNLKEMEPEYMLKNKTNNPGGSS
jgi:hypothetical protein